ncbi:MAG: amino acid ABC transporter substrate-binding protein [Duodenibacillus sp.]|nr:amino acid ABC transporter substrate-binding protein [Duodenibacillus sp.]
MKIKHVSLAVALAAAALTAQAGPVLDAVKARGQLLCGVNTAAPGFSSVDSQGKWSGLDVDTCRAVAAAVLGDAGKVKFVPLSSSQRFTALQSGEVDMLSRNTTWTITRDASQGVVFAAINYYDGQGFMVPKKLGVKSAKQLNGITVCLQTGTSSVQAIADYFAANKMKYKSVMFETTELTQDAFIRGRCQLYTTDMSDLAGARTRAPNPSDFVILPETISKEPLGPSVRRGDDEWFQIVRWSFYAMVEAEESGITKANVDELRANSKNPQIQRIVGSGDDTGKLLGLDKDWSYRIVKQVGNYGESWTANFGPKTALNLPRALNNLWTQGGLMYAPPIR